MIGPETLLEWMKTADAQGCELEVRFTGRRCSRGWPILRAVNISGDVADVTMIDFVRAKVALLDEQRAAS